MSNYDIDVIYTEELEIKDATDLDLRLEFDEDFRLCTRLYDKRDEFDFLIVNFPYISNNIPESPAHGIFVSQLIRYAPVQRIYSGFKVHHENFRLILGNSMVVIQTLYTNFNLLCHIYYVKGFVYRM